MDEKYEDWLPWYVNGTLGMAERSEMDRYLASNAEARSEALLFERAAEALSTHANRIPTDLGFAKTLKKNSAYRTNETRGDDEQVFDRMSAWLSAAKRWLGMSWLQPAFVVSLMGLCAQSLWLLYDRSDRQMRGQSAIDVQSRSDEMSYLRISFMPTATEGEIRLLVAGGRAKFVAGPSENGVYIVAVPNTDAVRLLDTLRNSRVVATANPSEAPK
jgi:hypothetical protein